MTIDLTLNLGHLITLGLFFMGALFGLVKWLAAQQEKTLAEKFNAINSTMSAVAADQRKEAEASHALKVEFLNWKAELPRDYVRRDDFVRAVGTIEARIDNFALRVERALTQGGKS